MLCPLNKNEAGPLSGKRVWQADTLAPSSYPSSVNTLFTLQFESFYARHATLSEDRKTRFCSVNAFARGDFAPYSDIFCLAATDLLSKLRASTWRTQ